MSTLRRLVIDIGTNSVLALLARVDGGRLSIIFDYKKTTKLGEGIMSSNRLSKSAINRTVNVIAEFKNQAHYDEIFLLGTEALRAASNAAEFSVALKNTINQESIILTGAKEAELSYLGSLYNLNINKSDLLLIDVGGGSTELVSGKNGEITNSMSIPMGALKLLELSDEVSIENYRNIARSIIEERIKNIRINDSTIIIATGGTITSAAGIAAGLSEFDASRIHGASLSVGQLLEIARRFEQSPVNLRPSLIPFDPERADLILPGLGIFLAILSIIGKDELVVSTGGLRYGAALYPDKIWA